MNWIVKLLILGIVGLAGWSMVQRIYNQWELNHLNQHKLDQMQFSEQYQTKILNRLIALQQQKFQNFSYFPFIPKPTFMKNEGLFESQIRLDYVDQENSYFSEWMTKHDNLYDNNNFVTSFILNNLLEYQELTGSDISKVVEKGLKGVSGFHDKNRKVEDSPFYIFWEQLQQINGTYQSQPYNLVKSIDILPDWSPEMQAWISKHLGGIFANAKGYLKVFKLVADLDDSSVNVALLSKLGSTDNQKYQQFYRNNKNVKELYSFVKQNAYTPLEVVNNNNTDFKDDSTWIDPRSYYAISQFLDQKYQKNESVVLPKTWLSNMTQTIVGVSAMPLYINNVDVSVVSNFLYGYLSCKFSGIEELEQQIRDVEDQKMKDMVRSSLDLIEWVITSGQLLKRYDILLLYYPSVFDFYWFISRVLVVLKSNQHRLLDMQDIYDKFRNVMENEVTQQMLSMAHADKVNDDLETVYWQEWIGNYANKTRGLDRMFSTTMALNALLNIWTVQEQGIRSIKYKDNTPSAIKQHLQKGMNYLFSQLEYNPSVSILNSFFSGSFKQLSSSPYIYPVNLAFTVKDKVPFKVSNLDYYKDYKEVISKLTNDSVLGMMGYVTADKYQYMKLNESYIFATDGQRQFDGNFNNLGEYWDGKQMIKMTGFGFPFWSSDSMFYSMYFNLLTKYQVVISN